MRALAPWLMAGLMAFAPLAASAAELRVLIWEAYLSEAVKDAFTAETGITIHEINYDSADRRDEILHDPSNHIDMALLSEGSIPGYTAQGYLAPFDDALKQRLAAYPERFRSLCGPHALPYEWGTVGIVYRADRISAPPARWGDLLDPAPSLSGRIAMMDDYSEGLGPALIDAGRSANATDEQSLRAAFERMKMQARSVLTYTYIISSIKDPDLADRLELGLAYSGDEKVLNEIIGKELWKFSQPQGRTRLWVDCLAALKSSPNLDRAMAFIRFLSRPDIAARNAADLKMPPASDLAMAYMPDEARSHPLIARRDQIIADGEFGTTLPRAAIRQRQRIIRSLVNFHAAR